MAIIREMPGQKIIDGFKGKIDFYYHDGIACARRWPRSQGKSQTPASVAQQPAFAYCSRLWMSAAPIVRDAYAAMASATGLHQKDAFTRAYYGTLLRYPPDYTP